VDAKGFIIPKKIGKEINSIVKGTFGKKKRPNVSPITI